MHNNTNQVDTHDMPDTTDNFPTTACISSVKKQLTPKIEKTKYNTAPAYVRTTRIEHVVCPMHILELTRNLEKINISETLRVMVGGCAVEAELLAVSRTLGHEAITVEKNGQNELFITRKK